MEYFASSIPGFGGISFKSIHDSSNRQLLLRYPSRKHSPNRRNVAPGPVEIRTCSPGSLWNEWSHPLKDPEPDGFYAAHLERKALPYIGGPYPPPGASGIVQFPVPSLRFRNRFLLCRHRSPIVSLRSEHAAPHDHKTAYFLQVPQQVCWSTQLFHVEQFGTKRASHWCSLNEFI
jgi:hypothetical protein